MSYPSDVYKETDMARYLYVFAALIALSSCGSEDATTNNESILGLTTPSSLSGVPSLN